ncbi:MAG: undecaprenyl-diphosphate phosphatase [Microbacteriaceae bacterium]|nr:undecaprenyl-diphosphate phosphatase [Microbacteriaceae bacterium]MCL2794854.1 undecaprenyl-diphosphate phosphatase [Microbacteriaceae bacterium]
MHFWQALVLGIVEGVTEFLPVSSTGHLTIVEKLLGLQVNDKGVTAFTAIIQVGAIVAVIIYFWRDIVRLLGAWFRGLANRNARGQDYRLAWFVIIGTIPVGIVGLLGRHFISGPLRNLWVVAVALVVWSFVMWFAERVALKQRNEEKMNLTDAVFIGVMQCFALVPGVSRSGATISAGLMRGLDRVAATRISFFLSIPALLAAGGFEALTSAKDISHTVGWGMTGVATLVSLIVAYASIAWLLRFVQNHKISVFIWYRVAVAIVVALLLGFGVISAT